MNKIQNLLSLMILAAAIPVSALNGRTGPVRPFGGTSLPTVPNINMPVGAPSLPSPRFPAGLPRGVRLPTRIDGVLPGALPLPTVLPPRFPRPPLPPVAFDEGFAGDEGLGGMPALLPKSPKGPPPAALALEIPRETAEGRVDIKKVGAWLDQQFDNRRVAAPAEERELVLAR